ncbi:hypothetical protein RIF29_31802 [Crotalaria pallida]|uniref:RING-type E3 ubiquitin transferase n=1 Tax=Crotalaria pallida TaxID=3830 RepID=A0AAN9HXD4_CROPI
MELYYYNNNRRLLLLNHDLPFPTTSMSPELEPPSTTINDNTSSPSSSSSSSEFETTSQLPPRPIFSSNIGYAFIIFFTALFILGFVILYMRRERSSPAREEHVDTTASTAKSLPEFPYCRGGGDDDDEEGKRKVDDCAICLEEFREGEKVKMIVYCNHVFHPHCIDTWLAKHVTCPICRCNKLGEFK